MIMQMNFRKNNQACQAKLFRFHLIYYLLFALNSSKAPLYITNRFT